MFAVSDTGIGMNEEIISHIFEPIFTTKPKGSGTGLRLSTCYGIVKQNNGNISVYSEPGKGTTFHVFLPACENMLFNERDHKAVPRHKGTETILLVEDDTVIREKMTKVLSVEGYTVITASNGEEVLAVIRDSSRPFDLLITDVVMPLMGGREFADRVKDQIPQMKVLFMSGYTDNSIIHNWILEPGTNFIQKPFSISEFMTKVREILDLK
jgi:CheY-like chemotaxis protein